MIVPQPVSFQISCAVTSGLEEAGLGHDVDGRQTHVAQGVDEDARAAQHLLPQRDHDDPRDEVGQVDDALDDAPDLVLIMPCSNSARMIGAGK